MLYHKDIFLPEMVKFLPEFQVKNPIYSRHAKTQAKCDRYGWICLPTKFIISGGNIIDAEIIGGKIEKLVVRISYNNKCDLCIVYMPYQNFVKTVWLNCKADKHCTLDKSRYSLE